MSSVPSHLAPCPCCQRSLDLCDCLVEAREPDLEDRIAIAATSLEAAGEPLLASVIRGWERLPTVLQVALSFLVGKRASKASRVPGGPL